MRETLLLSIIILILTGLYLWSAMNESYRYTVVCDDGLIVEYMAMSRKPQAEVCK